MVDYLVSQANSNMKSWDNQRLRHWLLVCIIHHDLLKILPRLTREQQARIAVYCMTHDINKVHLDYLKYSFPAHSS